MQARCVVTGGLVIAAFLAALDPAAAQVLEVRRTVLPATDAPGATWTPIEFTDPFEAPPVVLVTPVGSIGDDPFTVRVRAVTAEGFEALAVEAAGTDGPRGETDIAWLAVTPGVYNLGDGGFLEAGRLEVAVEQLGPAHGQAGETVPLRFDAPFREPPALLTQVMTAENESGNVPRQPARPFLTVAQTEVRVGGASIALERGDALPGAVNVPETVGWMAATAGGEQAFFDADGAVLPWVARHVAAPADRMGVDDGCVRTALPLGPDGPVPESAVFVSQSSRADARGGWARVCEIRQGELLYAIDVDTFRDDARTHAPEAVSVFVMRPGTAVPRDTATG